MSTPPIRFNDKTEDAFYYQAYLGKKWRFISKPRKIPGYVRWRAWLGGSDHALITVALLDNTVPLVWVKSNRFGRRALTRGGARYAGFRQELANVRLFNPSTGESVTYGHATKGTKRPREMWVRKP